jgi:hypothetical protein
MYDRFVADPRSFGGRTNSSISVVFGANRRAQTVCGLRLHPEARKGDQSGTRKGLALPAPVALRGARAGIPKQASPGSRATQPEFGHRWSDRYVSPGKHRCFSARTGSDPEALFSIFLQTGLFLCRPRHGSWRNSTNIACAPGPAHPRKRGHTRPRSTRKSAAILFCAAYDPLWTTSGGTIKARCDRPASHWYAFDDRPN